jgi:hypothetical protein
MVLALAVPAKTLVHLSAVDFVIIAIYFVLVLGIGFYLKRFAATGEDFFLAAEMTAGRWTRVRLPISDRLNCWDGPETLINTASLRPTGIGLEPYRRWFSSAS